MGLIAAKCTQCGANIEVDDSKEAGICPHCGTHFIMEKTTVNNVVINNIYMSDAYNGNAQQTCFQPLHSLLSKESDCTISSASDIYAPFKSLWKSFMFFFLDYVFIAICAFVFLSLVIVIPTALLNQINLMLTAFYFLAPFCVGTFVFLFVKRYLDKKKFFDMLTNHNFKSFADTKNAFSQNRITASEYKNSKKKLFSEFKNVIIKRYYKLLFCKQ